MKKPIPIVVAFVLLGAAPRARALQPLEEFVQGARRHNPANHEAKANREGAEAQGDQALGRVLPGLSLGGSYTRNQREVSFGGLTALPRDQWDAAVTLTVPLVDLSKLTAVAAARRAAEAARHHEAATCLETEARVVQGYYQLVADLALVESTSKALEVVKVNARMTEEALQAGTATSLDVERARAEVERQSQQLTGAQLAATLAARALQSQTGVSADTASRPELTDDLHPERPLAELAGNDTPAVQAATAARVAAERGALAQRLTLVPSLVGTASERFTNATAFLGGHREVWAATVSALWAFDVGSIPAMRARSAESSAARAREEAARLAASDAVFQLWSTVDANRTRSRSARAQATVSAHAAEIARTRYRSGVSTQLDLIQADRDAFTAEAARIESDADLLNARLQLRIAAGVDPFPGQTCRL